MTPNPLISKSAFLRFLECPRYGWLYRNRPDLVDMTQSRIARQGEEVEKLAQGLFEKGTKVLWKGASEDTKRMLNDGTPVIYQATFKTEKYLAKADILVRDADGTRWHLYEVKSTTREKAEHIQDLCFQAITFESAGLKLASVNLIYINNQYVFDAKKGLDIKQFFITQDLSEKIEKNKTKVADAMERAHAVLTSPEEPHPKILIKNFKYKATPRFEDYYWQGVPEYSIYDIGRITKRELTKLMEKGMTTIIELPNGYFKQDFKNLQIEVTKEQKPFIDYGRIAETLATFHYPLYFLDYETINPAIPMFDGNRPYRMICFQYSVHVKRAPGSDLEHVEFLHLNPDNPIPHLLKRLRSDIGDKGTVLVWFELFEKTRNKEMAKDYPEYREFLESVNERIYDLMKIVDEGMLEDYHFKGSASLKNVLPVLVPELSYEGLGVRHGHDAMDTWHELMEGGIIDREKAIRDMLEYCGQDTLAMVRILEVVEKKAG